MLAFGEMNLVLPLAGSRTELVRQRNTSCQPEDAASTRYCDPCRSEAQACGIRPGRRPGPGQHPRQLSRRQSLIFLRLKWKWTAQAKQIWI